MKWIKSIFRRKLLMSVYKDENGILYGGTIHEHNDKSYIDHVSHIKKPKFLGKIKI